MCISSGPTAVYAKFMFWRKTRVSVVQVPPGFWSVGRWAAAPGIFFSFFTPSVSHSANVLSPLIVSVLLYKAGKRQQVLGHSEPRETVAASFYGFQRASLEFAI